jgi:hypothetical protein
MLRPNCCITNDCAATQPAGGIYRLKFLWREALVVTGGWDRQATRRSGRSHCSVAAAVARQFSHPVTNSAGRVAAKRPPALGSVTQV